MTEKCQFKKNKIDFESLHRVKHTLSPRALKSLQGADDKLGQSPRTHLKQ